MTRVVIVGVLAAALVIQASVAPMPTPRAAAAMDAPEVTCVQDWRPAAAPPPIPAPSPEHRPFHLYCGARHVATTWMTPFVTDSDARRLTAEIVSQISFPDVRLAVNPQRGVTGLASWFWATPEASSVRLQTGNGPNIAFEVLVARAQWTFGEAGSATDSASGFGDAYPTPSAVQHTYERKGLYTVRAEVTLSARYWLDQAPGPGASSTRVVTLPHRVAEIRGLLHAR